MDFTTIDDENPENILNFKPAVASYRNAARQIDDPEKLAQIIDVMSKEMAYLKASMRAGGLIPGRLYNPEVIISSLIKPNTKQKASPTS